MPADIITSPANADIKLLRSLALRKYRRQTGWFLAEGMRICTEAVQLGHLPQRLVYAADRPDMPGLDRLIAACQTGGGPCRSARPCWGKSAARIIRKWLSRPLRWLRPARM